MKAVLTDVSYNKGLNFNLYSLRRMLVNGWTVTSGDANGITIRKGENVINFDIVIPRPRGAIFACRFLRDSDIHPGGQYQIGSLHECPESTWTIRSWG